MAKIKKKTKKNILKILEIVKSFFKVFWYIFQRLFLICFIFFMFVWFAWWSSLQPSLYRDWEITEAILPTISFSWNIISVKNVRNFDYTTKTDFKVWYYDENYDLDKIESVHYIVEPFSDFDWPAHTMLSFWFSDDKYVTLSAELRKEKWEWFDPVLWVLNQFELVYIVGDDNDLIKLRANVRKDIVRMYPVNATKEQKQMLFSSIMHRADKLTKEPEFYNTLWNTCTTSILKHVNSLRTNKISSTDIKILLPSNSDKIWYKLWLFNTNLSFDEAREYYKINSLSEEYKNDKDYSKIIRKELK